MGTTGRVFFEVVRTHDVEHGGPLTADERDIIEGTLELADKTSESILIPNSSVFKVSFDARLDDALMREILDSGRSRVPVYKDNEDNIIGLLLVKQLIRLHTPHRPNVSDIRLVPAVIVSTSSSLFDLLKTFRSGASHLAVVVRGAGGGLNSGFDQPPLASIGIVTLEDVLEAMMKRNIDDETDVRGYLGNRLKVGASKAKALSSDVNRALSRVSNRPADFSGAFIRCRRHPIG